MITVPISSSFHQNWLFHPPLKTMAWPWVLVAARASFLSCMIFMEAHQLLVCRLQSMGLQQLRPPRSEA